MVSGALDRLHYEKDPCVKYDVNRKLWIYLHRNRTEDEFGKVGKGLGRGEKSTIHVLIEAQCAGARGWVCIY